MSGAAAPDEVRGLGELLDRAVHQTFARFWLMVPAFVLADAVGSLVFDLPLGGGVPGYLALILVATIFENRARVVAIASAQRADRRSADWSQILRHPGALLFAVVGMLDGAVPYLALGLASLLFVSVRMFIAFSAFRVAPLYVLGVLAALVAAAALLVVLVLVSFAGLVATIDTVADGTAPHRALGRWLRRIFQRRSFGTTLLAAVAVALLVSGVPAVLAFAFPWGPHDVRAIVDAIPEGAADAVALMFAWRWRDAVLDRREGRDIAALLDARDGAATAR